MTIYHHLRNQELPRTKKSFSHEIFIRKKSINSTIFSIIIKFIIVLNINEVKITNPYLAAFPLSVDVQMRSIRVHNKIIIHLLAILIAPQFETFFYFHLSKNKKRNNEFANLMTHLQIFSA